jgi:hypothetical protein
MQHPLDMSQNFNPNINLHPFPQPLKPSTKSLKEALLKGMNKTKTSNITLF